MIRVICFSFFAMVLLFTPGCKVSQGNGEAQPQNTSKGYNPDKERNNTRQGGTGGPGNTTTGSAQPVRSQTPSHPSSRIGH